MIAAGGLMRGGQIAAVLAAGAYAAALGTAFLVCPESGAHALHKRAITDPVFARTELTRAFSGRPARGLVNRFMREHGRYAPPGYPQVHHLTQPLRKAAAAARRRAGHVAVGGAGPPARPRAVRRRPRRDPRRRTPRRPGGPRMTAPVFLVAPGALDGSPATVTLDGAEGRHAVSVRRLRAGEEVVLTDGAGRGAEGVVSAVTGKDVLTVEVRAVRSEPEPGVSLTVVQALPKGDRGELAVETMTEVGVDAVVPWAASRCVTQWRGERGAKSLAKWRATGREAAKQARRLRVPPVADPMTTRQVCELLSAADFAGVLHEEASLALATAELPAAGTVVLVVGPEGGVSPDELRQFGEAGAPPYRLGPTVLRTSTAGVAAASLLLARTHRWA